MLRDGWLKEWITKDGPYIIALLLALSAIIYLWNGTDKAVEECNRFWAEQYSEVLPIGLVGSELFNMTEVIDYGNKSKYQDTSG